MRVWEAGRQWVVPGGLPGGGSVMRLVDGSELYSGAPWASIGVFLSLLCAR